MNQTLKNWIAAGAAVIALTGVSYLLDGPSATELEEAQAADLADARRDARRHAALLKRCQELRGPAAELRQIEGSDDYVCR